MHWQTADSHDVVTSVMHQIPTLNYRGIRICIVITHHFVVEVMQSMCCVCVSLCVFGRLLLNKMTHDVDIWQHGSS